MRTSSILSLACAAALAAAALPANAATQAECEAAIAETERAIEDSPALAMEAEGKSDEAETFLAEAGAAGQEGDYERCMERVQAAKNSAGVE